MKLKKVIAVIVVLAVTVGAVTGGIYVVRALEGEETLSQIVQAGEDDHAR